MMESHTEMAAILSDPEGQLASLQDTFHKVQSKFSDWTKQLGVQLEAKHAAHLDTLVQQKENVATMMEKIDSLKNEQHLQQTANEKLKLETQKLETAVERVKPETDALLLQKENLAQASSQLRAANARERELLELQGTHNEKIAKELDLAASYFSDRLGLQLKKVSGGRMQMIFTLIDYKEPTRPFYCFVKITSQRKYEVTECTPAVEGFQEIVDKLNSDNDFSAFVIALRKGFKTTL